MSLQSLIDDMRQAIAVDNIDRIREIHTNNPELLNHQNSIDLRYLLLWKVTDCNNLEILDLLVNYLKFLEFGPEDDLNAYLCHAIQTGNVPFTEFLLRNGARLEDCGDNLVWHIFCENDIKARKEIVALLVKYDLNTKVKNILEDDILHQFLYVIVGMVNSTDVKLVDELPSFLFHVARPLTMVFLEQDDKSCTSMMEKETHDKEIMEIIQLNLSYRDLLDILFSAGAEINSKNKITGFTALHIACLYHNRLMIDYLVCKGADITVEDTCGNTPLSLLNPKSAHYGECCAMMIREISKLFYEKRSIAKKDMEIIKSKSKIQKYFNKCCFELKQEFYASYSLYSVLKMSNNIKKLANLLMNEDFVEHFQKNMTKFCYYEDDLQVILGKAMKARDNILIIESKINTLFGNVFPSVVKENFIKYLTFEDLAFVGND